MEAHATIKCPACQKTFPKKEWFAGPKPAPTVPPVSVAKTDAPTVGWQWPMIVNKILLWMVGAPALFVIVVGCLLVITVGGSLVAPGGFAPSDRECFLIAARLVGVAATIYILRQAIDVAGKMLNFLNS